MSPDDLVVNDRLTVAADELEWRFSASGGPGGQHVNTANTRVELTFDVRASASLEEADRERLLARIGPLVRVVAQSERSQLRNRQLARERLAQRLRAALQVAPPRRATRPTRASVERRIARKRERAEKKSTRRPPRRDED